MTDLQYFDFWFIFIVFFKPLRFRSFVFQHIITSFVNFIYSYDLFFHRSPDTRSSHFEGNMTVAMGF